MNLMDRKAQEEFFHDYLQKSLPDNTGIRIAAASYDDEWSALRFLTEAGPIIIRVNEIEKPETDVPHRTAFVARLLAETGSRSPEEFIRSDKGLFESTYANFETPIVCPDGAEVFGWDSTRKLWPRPFYLRRWVDGTNLAATPKPDYFKQAGKALRRIHRVRFKKPYASFKAVAKDGAAGKENIFVIEKALEAVETLLPLVTVAAVRKLAKTPENAEVGLLSNSFFGNNILIDDMGRVRVPDWEKAGIGDLAQDFFPLKYWTIVDRRSGWYIPDAGLFRAFCKGYGIDEYKALENRPEFLYLEVQWLLQRLGAASRRWTEGGLREPYPEPAFYIGSLRALLDT